MTSAQKFFTGTASRKFHNACKGCLLLSHRGRVKQATGCKESYREPICTMGAKEGYLCS